jgi:hypothetical protein
MRLHRIVWSSGARYIDLDHILALDPPAEGAYDYSFDIWLAFHDKPMRIYDDRFDLMACLRHEQIDKAFRELFKAWSGQEYEHDKARN